MSQDTARERHGVTLEPDTVSRSDWVDLINGALLDPGNGHLDDGVAVFDALQPELDRLAADNQRLSDLVEEFRKRDAAAEKSVKLGLREREAARAEAKALRTRLAEMEAIVNGLP